MHITEELLKREPKDLELNLLRLSPLTASAKPNTFMGREGEAERMYTKGVDLADALNVSHPSSTSQANVVNLL